jgi:hypothetical protein
VRIALLVMTDGRDDYLRQAMDSLDQLHGPIGERWMHDDTGDAVQRSELAARYPGYAQLGDGPRRGFDGAISRAWDQLTARSTADMVFHVEQDFVFRRAVDLAAMAAALDDELELAQMALRRQPWAAPEHAAGGVVEMHPDAYADRLSGDGHPYLRHRLFFTTNPCLYRRGLCAGGWPSGEHSEGRFTAQLLAAGPDVGFGYWGCRSDPPWVEHIGHRRVGMGY